MAKVDERMFSAVKLLLENGASQAETAKYMKLTKWTVCNINKAETLEEYRHIVAAMKAEQNSKQKKPEKKPEQKPDVQVVEHRQNVTIQATHYMMTELQKTNEMLALISNKLAFIVDELCGVKKEA